MAAESVWKLGGLSVRELGKRVWNEIDKDDVLGHSAELAYYFTFALFPLLLVLISVLGMLASTGSAVRSSLMQYMADVMPGSANQLIQSTLTEITKSSGGGKLSFGLILSLWSASAGVAALMSTLNVTYDVKEGRPFWKVRAIAVALTIALSILIISSLILVLYGGRIADGVGNAIHMGSAFTIGWRVVQWPVAIFFLLVSFAMVYYFAPNVEHRKWYWITPGSVLGVFLWLVASIGFKIYLNYFNTYSATYGSVGAVIILLTWLYVSGVAILIGSEVNSEIEHAAAAHGDPEAKAEGGKTPQGVQSAKSRPAEKRPAA